MTAGAAGEGCLYKKTFMTRYGGAVGISHRKQRRLLPCIFIFCPRREEKALKVLLNEVHMNKTM